MNNKQKSLIDLVIIGMVATGLIMTLSSSEEDESKCLGDMCIEDFCEDNEYCGNDFKYVFDRFKIYNPDIDKVTVKLFLDVATYYGFKDDPTTFKLAVGQILLESGANQYYHVGHPHEFELVTSYAGAIGITQIMPTTAHYYMSRILSEWDIKIMKNFGSTDFSFVHNDNLEYDVKVEMCKEWLSISENNIILWGCIMRYNMTKYNSNIINSLVAYNAGRGGLNRLVNKGYPIWRHSYIKGINKRLIRVERELESAEISS